MATSASRKAVMTLFCSPTSAYCHRTRFVLSEKGIVADIEYIERGVRSENLLAMNPRGSIPTMVDRDLVLYDSRIIMEYLDERFPHPPLHPMDPVAKARARMLMHRIDQDWIQLLDEIEKSPNNPKAKKQLRDSLIAAASVFAAKRYFLSDDFSLVDCTLAPLLWRLPALGIDIPRHAGAITDYAKRLFERTAFRASLSEQERDFSNFAESAPTA